MLIQMLHKHQVYCTSAVLETLISSSDNLQGPSCTQPLKNTHTETKKKRKDKIYIDLSMGEIS